MTHRDLTLIAADGDRRSAGWARLLADVTGRPGFATALLAALARPLTIDEQRRIDTILAIPAPQPSGRVRDFARCWRSADPVRSIDSSRTKR